MKSILSKITIPLLWAYYTALMYTAYNPNHDYVNYLENANVLYLIVHVPVNFLFGIIALVMFFSKDKLIKEVSKKMEDEGEDKREKAIKAMRNLKSMKTRFIFSVGTVFVLGAMFSSFIFLEYFFLGTVMLVGFVVGRTLTSFCSELSKEFSNE